jgi:hypothetical protein
MIKNDAQRREQEELIDFHQSDKQYRAEYLEEWNSGLAMQIPGNAALPEVGVDHREQVHAGANRHDIAKSHRGVEAANDPGQAKRIDDPVEGTKGEKHDEELAHRRLGERRRDIGDGYEPENECKNKQRPDIWKRPSPLTCRRRRDESYSIRLHTDLMMHRPILSGLGQKFPAEYIRLPCSTSARRHNNGHFPHLRVRCPYDVAARLDLHLNQVRDVKQVRRNFPEHWQHISKN